MNYLAHLYLSGNDPDVFLGNFMADQIKGRDLSAYSSGVRRGIVLHRRIDHFTDTSDLNKAGKDLLRPSMGKFSGIVLDVFYDHFLAVKWAEHHGTPLPDFIRNSYEFLGSRKSEMPIRTQEMFFFMRQQDWLSGYIEIEGIGRALTGLSRRVTNGEIMANSKDELINNYAELSECFDRFFPAIKEFCTGFLKGIDKF